VTPAWISSVPNKVGASGIGKIKADQWRTLGTLHFPVSLAVVWSSTGTELHGPKGKLLDTTFSLVSAILIACSHNTSPAHAKAYLRYMQNYIDGIKQLDPTFKFLPNHHMALHLQEYLEQYGPVHSWWTFPFERLIGIMQRIPSNGKPGEYLVPIVIKRLKLTASQVNMKKRSQNLTVVLPISGPWLPKQGVPRRLDTVNHFYRSLALKTAARSLQISEAWTRKHCFQLMKVKATRKHCFQLMKVKAT